MYTTNAIEAVNSSFRKVTKKGSFPSEDAVMKALYLRVTELYKMEQPPSPELGAGEEPAFDGRQNAGKDTKIRGLLTRIQKPDSKKAAMHIKKSILAYRNSTPFYKTI